MLRGFARWVREVVVAQEMGEPVPIALQRFDGGYAFHVGLRAGFGGHDEARIPVSRRTNPSPHPILKEIHSCEVAGRELQAANVMALMAKAAAQLEQIAPGGSLPLCWFRAPATDYELPVYEDDNEIVCPLLGRKRLKARTLAGIRRQVCRHLVNAGYLRETEEAEVGVLQPRDLRRVTPVAVLRSLADDTVWLPCVEGVGPEGPVVGVLDHGFRLGFGGRRRAAGPAGRERVPAAPDVIALLRSVRAELERNTSPPTPGTVAALFASEVAPEAWRAAAAHTEDAGVRVIAQLEEGTRLELEVRRTGAHDYAAAVEDRGVNVFLAASHDALAALVTRRLTASGFLRSARDVEVVPVAEERAERLSADDIWTHSPEEAHA